MQMELEDEQLASWRKMTLMLREKEVAKEAAKESEKAKASEKIKAPVKAKVVKKE